jgi:hypothetical protein
MPLTTRKKSKGNPDDVMVCHTSFVMEGAGGNFRAYHVGDRIRREIIAREVSDYADYFKLDGAADPIPTDITTPTYDDPRAAKILEPLALGEAAVCINGLVTLHEGKMVGIVAGERIPKDHPLVKKFRDRFELEEPGSAATLGGSPAS